MAEKVTIMVLSVDLQCPCCYKKVKKILCKFPQIRDQVYNEKANTVTITVVCSNPEKIRDKLYCKGDKVIRSIEIKEPPKPEKPKPPEEKPPPRPCVEIIPNPPKWPCCGPCCVGHCGGPCCHGCTQPCFRGCEPPKPVKPKPPEEKPPPRPCVEIIPNPPKWPCCGPCSVGHCGGPCCHGCTQPCFRGCHITCRCDGYFCEENPQACSIM